MAFITNTGSRPPSIPSSGSTPSPEKHKTSSDIRSWSFTDNPIVGWVGAVIKKLSGSEQPKPSPKFEERLVAPVPTSPQITPPLPMTKTKPMDIPKGHQEACLRQAVKDLEDHLEKHDLYSNVDPFGTYFGSGFQLAEVIEKRKRELEKKEMVITDAVSELKTQYHDEELKLGLQLSLEILKRNNFYCSKPTTIENLKEGRELLREAQTHHELMIQRCNNDDLKQSIDTLKAHLLRIEKESDLKQADLILLQIKSYCTALSLDPNKAELGKQLIQEAKELQQFLVEKYNINILHEPLKALRVHMQSEADHKAAIELKEGIKNYISSPALNIDQMGQQLLLEGERLNLTDNFVRKLLEVPLQELTSHLQKKADIKTGEELKKEIINYFSLDTKPKKEEIEQWIFKATAHHLLLVKKYGLPGVLGEILLEVNDRLKEMDLKDADVLITKIHQYCLSHSTLPNREAIGSQMLRDAHALNERLKNKYNNNLLELPYRMLIQIITKRRE